MKSIVMQTTGKRAVVLGDDGAFRRVPNRGYRVGQAIHTAPAVGLRKVVAIAAAAAVFLASGTTLAYYTPVSYATVDINPSIEFQLNLVGHVIGARGVNEDGKALLAHVQTGVNLGQNIRAVVREAAAEGYLTKNDENAVIVTVAGPSEEQAQQEAQEAEAKAKEALDEAALPGKVEAEHVGYARVQEAHRLGTTPGKLNLVQKYIDSADPDVQVNVEEWLDKPVKDIMKAIKDNRKATRAAAKAAPTATPEGTATAEPGATASPTVGPTPTAAATGGPKVTDDKDKGRPDKTPKPDKTLKPDKTQKPEKTPKPNQGKK